ncbi:hypothetical protein Pelo_3216 [Pelomyxa schiedti]|nr:hypothetical protein Pelo_3216 [Pelomyxa schiedti]
MGNATQVGGGGPVEGGGISQTTSTSVSMNPQAEDVKPNLTNPGGPGDAAAVPPFLPNAVHGHHHPGSTAQNTAAERTGVADEMEAVVRPLGSNPLWMTSCWHLACARCARKAVTRGTCTECKREVHKLVRTFFVHKTQ